MSLGETCLENQLFENVERQSLLVDNMDSSTDDSITSTEDVKSRMAESFDSYIEQDDTSDGNKDSPPNMRTYPNLKHLLATENHDGLYPEQFTKECIYEHQSKRKKLNNGEAIGTDAFSEKSIDDNEAMDNTDIDGGESNVSRKIQHMMKKMGYKPGRGLGKDDQGRVEPIEAVTQHGRRGFGHSVPGLKEASLKWNPQDEEINVIEDIEWICSNTPFTDYYMLEDWIKMGPKKLSIDDEHMFCSPIILKHIIEAKTVFDRLDKSELRRARLRSNPYETIRSGIFLNRAAVKMANIDRACDFIFTKPKNLDNNELLYFADVCAGPGGFSEYILFRKKWHAMGFGFTLKNENDFKLDDFLAGPCETFHPFYGSKDNGDVFDAQNQQEFADLVMKHTNNSGVHFMMSDGGFSVEGQENIQEILSKQLYLCQCLVALMIVRPGGHFVTKLFDLFTPFSVGLVYLMYKCFDGISIFKPNTSRPANSERYLICKSKRNDTHEIIDYLTEINRLLSMNDNDKDVVEIVPLDVLSADIQFINYLRNSNDIIGKRQLVNLLKIAAFCEDETLIEPKQADMRKECLKHWQLPDKTRVRPRVSKPQDKALEILGEFVRLLKCEATKLKSDNIQNTILNHPYDWYCMPCSSGPYVEEDKLATFYLGLGRRMVYRYVRNKWDLVGDAKIELPANTLVYAELVYETRWTGKYFSKTRALHIIDAYMLGGEDVSSMYLSQRYKLTKKFCDAIWKPIPSDYICIRAKERFLLTPDIHKRLRITQRRVKLPIAFELTKNPLEYGNINEPVYAAFNSVIFVRSIAKPWARHLSQKTREYYVHNSGTGQSEYEIRDKMNNRPSDAEAKFTVAFEERVTWSWPHDAHDTLNMENLIQLLNPPKRT
ncbi:PREDICTED: cap-specific mRNA (nucleoside-2'-O-)-methyltransferase 1 isoform X1 [Wasmannia auropunctata]|uniref:cap-specific mRNA (nucleoside-2'-O-)-methyltransferase 1 isoform X1 n=2 Tax=Wasmannia auropunctata TaxID=64793 RepID=UPI0005EED49B|nr:PREDICTED: cap-specific mRNA (nucleoside-2'-O-)-methyltransferase 1 isoform X1 [Wasmannia auropunctata]